MACSSVGLVVFAYGALSRHSCGARVPNCVPWLRLVFIARLTAVAQVARGGRVGLVVDGAGLEIGCEWLRGGSHFQLGFAWQRR